MKKIVLSMFACVAMAAAVAGVGSVAQKYVKSDSAQKLAYEADAQAAREKAQTEKMIQTLMGKQKAPEYNWEGTDTVTYYVVAQSATEGYSYSHNGGDIFTYDMGVCRNGDKVSFSNLTNIYDPTNTWNPLKCNAIDGTYDEATGIITVATPIAGNANDNNYTYDFVCGTFDEHGNLEPADNFCLTATEGLAEISTDTDFGHQYTYGFLKRYHSLKAFKKDADSPANLVRFAEGIEFGQAYAGMKVAKTWRVINAGGTEAEYVINIDADDDAFTCDEMSGVIEPYSDKEITFYFQPNAVGEFEGLATLETEEGNPILIQFAGECIETPDYSAIVKNGDFRFETGIDFPFAIKNVDHPIYNEDGTDSGETENITVASSSTEGQYGTSFLKAHFNVPVGKLGKLSFKGHFTNKGGAAGWYKVSSFILVDDDNNYIAKYNYTGNYAAEHTYYEFSPGDHYLYIYHDNAYYTGYPEDGTYIWDLDLQLEDSLGDAAELLTPEVNMGNTLLEKGGVATKDANIVLNNKGVNLLEVLSVASDNDEFKLSVPGNKVGQLEDINVPVQLQAKTTGEKVANITVSTTAGEFTAVVKANVIDKPDYLSLFTGNTEILTFTYNEEYPFIIENGKAYNITSKVLDKQPTFSSFGFEYDVPEGKFATFSWDGHAWGTPAEEFKNISTYDNAGIIIQNPNGNSGSSAVFDNDVDYSSNVLAENEYYQALLIASKGHGSFEFYYSQGGDNRYFGEDRFEVSNFNVTLIDSKEDAVEVLTPEVEFQPVFVGPGRYSTAKVRLRNLGTNNLVVNEIPASEPFYGIEPTQELPTKFYQTLDIELWFYPFEEGEFEKDLTIKTSAGDVTVHCKGKTLSEDGVIYNGDFEDNAYGWVVFDADRDGESWNLATNLFGERPTYVHSGVQALVSVSQSLNLGAVTPDNWTVSPAIEVPEEGGKLTYYVSAFSEDAYEEHYSLYIVDRFEDTLDDFNGVEPVIEETLDTPTWQEERNGYVFGWVLREVDLTPYAGKTIWLAYRHHDCTGQYMIRLDDVKAYKGNVGINMTEGTMGHGIVRQEIYTTDGTRVSTLQNGVNIIRTYYDNGKAITSKVIYKK